MEPTGKHPFVGIVVAAIVGILLQDFWPQPIQTGLLVTTVSLVLWIASRTTITLLTLVAGLFYLIHGLQFERNPARELAGELAKQEMTVTGSGIVDSIPSETVSSNGKIRSRFLIRDARLILRNDRSTRPLELLVNWPTAGLQIGDEISFEGNLANVEKPRNPGEFDYASWLGRQQVFSQVIISSEKNATRRTVGSPLDLRRMANQTKLKLAEVITRDLTNSPIEAGVITAMMLGAKNDTPDATLELFMKTGTLHLFSVSGLHVSMLATITLFILLLLRVPRRVALSLTIPAVFIYAFITGWSPSSVRAAMMTSAFVVATLLDRRSLSINTLAIAGFLLLTFNTNQLFSTGFQLSFSVVAAIILLQGPISRVMKNLTDPDPFIPRKLLTAGQKTRWLIANKLGGSVALTLAAWVGSLPLTAWYFNLWSPIALLANLAVIPLAFAILTLNVLSVMSLLVGNWLLIFFNNASWGLVKVLLALLTFFSWIPGSSFFVGPHWWQRSHHERVTFFDLGSGSATVIETSGKCWLIDCGSDGDYRQIVRSYLQQRGINQVDGIFLTHGDGGHVGGITQFLLDFPKATVFLPEAGRRSLVFRRLIDQRKVHWISSGFTMSIDETTNVQVVWPPPTVDSRRADEHSLVLKLTVENQKFLLVGDAGLITEMNLMEAGSTIDLTSDWLVIGRNRNDPGGDLSFVKKVAPRALLTTASNFPSSERIPEAMVNVCRELGIPFYRFDETGAVQFEIAHGRTDVFTFLGAPSGS